MAVCLEMERASQQARKGVLTEIQARKVVSDIVERVSGEPIVFYTIIEWVQNWLEMKGEIKIKRTHERYKGVIDGFLKFLGNKAKRNLTLLTQKDIHGFRIRLKKDGLSNTSCRALLETTI
jgi:hypothetical protein